MIAGGVIGIILNPLLAVQSGEAQMIYEEMCLTLCGSKVELMGANGAKARHKAWYLPCQEISVGRKKSLKTTKRRGLRNYINMGAFKLFWSSVFSLVSLSGQYQA